MKISTYIIVLVSALLVGCNDGPRPQVYVVAMLGQSNAVGHASIPHDADLTPHSRVMAYTRSGAIAPATDPLDGCDGGWGVALGRLIASDHPDAVVLLVPAAVNGSSIEEWMAANGYLQPALRRMADAMEAAEAIGQPTLKAVVWDQGESDMMSEDRAAAWAERFARLVEAIERNWPVARFVWAVTAQPQAEPATRLLWWREVQDAQRSVAVTNGRAVDMTDLPMEPDGVHRTWHAQQWAAVRFYEALNGP